MGGLGAWRSKDGKPSPCATKDTKWSRIAESTLGYFLSNSSLRPWDLRNCIRAKLTGGLLLLTAPVVP